MLFVYSRHLFHYSIAKRFSHAGLKHLMVQNSTSDLTSCQAISVAFITMIITSNYYPTCLSPVRCLYNTSNIINLQQIHNWNQYNVVALRIFLNLYYNTHSLFKIHIYSENIFFGLFESAIKIKLNYVTPCLFLFDELSTSTSNSSLIFKK